MNLACRIKGLQKSFGDNHVLRDVSLDLLAGNVTVLMGANGAGKSTLVKILCGVHERDSGSIELFGRAFAPETPVAAIDAGIVTVHQLIDDGVIPDLDVASNLTLDEFNKREFGFFIRKKKIRERAKEIAAIMDLDIPLDMPVSDLDVADRQLIGIARAMARKPKVLILDEPTSSLSATEAERLFKIVGNLRKTGVAVLYISHRMSDIRAVADRIICMRDGAIVGTFDKKPLDYEAAVTAMLGHQMTETDIKTPKAGAPIIEFRNLKLFKTSAPINLKCSRNEVVAITGLLGSGKTRLAEYLFGIREFAAGSIFLDGAEYKCKSPDAAIAAGVFLCPKDRASNALIPDFDLTDNMTLPFYRRYSLFGFLRRARQGKKTLKMINDLGVVCRSEKDMIATLSGGNQQKIVVGRWLSEACRLLVLDEPFQGVDIRARRDIGAFIRASADSRATIVLVAELDEALEIADRIVIINEGEIAGEHMNKSVDMNRIMAQVSGRKAA